MERLAGQQPPFAWASRVASLAAQGLAVVGLCIFLGQLASRGAFGTELLGLLLLIAVALAITIPPHVLIALSLLVFGAYSVSANHFSFGGVQLYSTDALLAVLLLRGILPRDRIPSPAPLNGVARLLFGIFAVVMIIAGLRGFFSGYGLVSIIRLETPLIYGAGFYLAFSRIVRERSFDLDKAVRNLLVVAFGFIAYMAFARLTGSTFETNQTVGRLGIVVTTGGVLRRDYGLSSAFIVYPVLALAGAAYLTYSPRRTALAAIVAVVGTFTTLLTLIRAEIFGLFVGLAVIALLRSDPELKRAGRTRAVMAASFALIIGAIGVWGVSPPTARGVAERSLPGLVKQSEAADSTAKYRREALKAGFASVRRHPAGVGLIPEQELAAASGVDPGYLAHSGVTTVLVYAGWFGLIAAGLALVGLLRASFTVPRPVPWLHALFIGLVPMLAVYTLAVSGLMGQGWIVGIAALIAALRFNAAGAVD
jgi:hypothetical protein